MIIPEYVTEPTADLFQILSESTNLNLQVGNRSAGRLQKQVVVNLYEKNGLKVIDGHYYMPDKYKFRFDITIHNLAKREFSLALYKKNPTPEEIRIVLEEITNLKEKAISRKLQKGGPTEFPTELYLQTGKITTDHSKMRFVQAHIKSEYPKDLLEIYKARNFKIVGKGNYPDLDNWQEEAGRLGIAV